MYRQNKIKPRKIASLLSQAAATNLKALTSQIRSEKEFKQKTKQNNKEKKKKTCAKLIAGECLRTLLCTYQKLRSHNGDRQSHGFNLQAFLP